MQGHKSSRWALALAVGSVVFVTACSSSAKSGSSAESASTTSQAAPVASQAAAGSSSSSAAASYKIAYILGDTADESFAQEKCGAKAQATKLGVNVTFQGPPKFDATLEIPIVNAVAATKPDALIITPNDSTALYAPLKQLADAGTKVITTDNPLTNPAGVVQTHVSADFSVGGRTSADALAKAVGGASGSVLILAVQPGIQSQDAAVNGFLDELKKYPNLKPLATQYDANDGTKAAQITQATIAAHSDLVGIFGANTASTTGAGTGLKNRAQAGDIKLVGMTSSSSVPLLQQGTAAALIMGNQTDVGAKAVQAAVDVLQGKSVGTNIAADYITVTADNLDSPDAAPVVGNASC